MPPRPVLKFPDEVVYGQRWTESNHEYRTVKLPRETYRVYKQFIAASAKQHSTSSDSPRLLAESEWRGVLGLQMSTGWNHCMVWSKEPNILVFQRPAVLTNSGSMATTTTSATSQPPPQVSVVQHPHANFHHPPPSSSTTAATAASYHLASSICP